MTLVEGLERTQATSSTEGLSDSAEEHALLYWRPYLRTWWAVPFGETMQRVNIYQFYRFGYAIRALSTITNKSQIYEEVTTLFDARRALADLLSQQQISMAGIKPAINALIGRIDQIMTLVEGSEDLPEDYTIPAKLAHVLREAFSRFETVFEAEIVDRGTNAYAVATKGIYDTSLLITNADLVIPEDLRPVLSDVARYDLRESGRCLAFEVPTAAGFHVLRASEAIIKEYYKSLTGKEWDQTHKREST